MAVSDTTRVARNAARRERERELVDATKALFDQRGLQDAPIEDIARGAGINKALIYRHFGSKEELFVLTVTRYLEELAEALGRVDEGLGPEAQLTDCWMRYTGFCLQYPAFLDCALSLMRRPARDLNAAVSDAVWFRLGQRMAACLRVPSRILAFGASEGAFEIDDPDFTANRLYVQALGTMHLARIGVGVREAAPGVPEVFRISPDAVQQACVSDALAAVLKSPRSRP